MSAKGQCKEQCAPVPVCQDQAPAKCCPNPCAPVSYQDPCAPDPCCQKQGQSGKGYAGQGGQAGYGLGSGKK